MSYYLIRYSSSKIVHLFHITLFVVLDLVTLCKYCNFHSEVYFCNNFYTIHYLLLFVQELYSKEPGGFDITRNSMKIIWMSLAIPKMIQRNIPDSTA